MSRNQRTPTQTRALDLYFQLRNKAKWNEMIMNIKAFATTMIEEVLGAECDLPLISVKAIRGENRVTLAMPKTYADAINKFAPNGSVTLPDGPEGDSELTIKTAAKESDGNIVDDGMSATWWAHAEINIALGISLSAYQDALDHHFHKFGFYLVEAAKPVPDKTTGMASNLLHVQFRPCDARACCAQNGMRYLKMGPPKQDGPKVKITFSVEWCTIMRVRGCCLRAKDLCLCNYDKDKKRPATHAGAGHAVARFKEQQKRQRLAQAKLKAAATEAAMIAAAEEEAKATAEAEAAEEAAEAAAAEATAGDEDEAPRLPAVEL